MRTHRSRISDVIGCTIPQALALPTAASPALPALAMTPALAEVEIALAMPADALAEPGIAIERKTKGSLPTRSAKTSNRRTRLQQPRTGRNLSASERHPDLDGRRPKHYDHEKRIR